MEKEKNELVARPGRVVFSAWLGGVAFGVAGGLLLSLSSDLVLILRGQLLSSKGSRLSIIGI